MPKALIDCARATFGQRAKQVSNMGLRCLSVDRAAPQRPISRLIIAHALKLGQSLPGCTVTMLFNFQTDEPLECGEPSEPLVTCDKHMSP